MKNFFDCILYKLFCWFDKQDKDIERHGIDPINKGNPFHPIYALSFVQGFNVFTIIILLGLCLGISKYLERVDFILYGSVGASFIYNYYYYKYLGNYKKIKRDSSRFKKFSNFLVVLYIALSISMGVFVVGIKSGRVHF